MELENDINDYFKVGSIFRSTDSRDKNSKQFEGDKIKESHSYSKTSDFSTDSQLQKSIAMTDAFANDDREDLSSDGEDICKHRRRQKLRCLIKNPTYQRLNRLRSEETVCSFSSDVNNTYKPPYDNCHQSRFEFCSDSKACDSGSSTDGADMLGSISQYKSMDELSSIDRPQLTFIEQRDNKQKSCNRKVKHAGIDKIGQIEGHHIKTGFDKMTQAKGLEKWKFDVDGDEQNHKKMSLTFSTFNKDQSIENETDFDHFVETSQDQNHLKLLIQSSTSTGMPRIKNQIVQNEHLEGKSFILSESKHFSPRVSTTKLSSKIRITKRHSSKRQGGSKSDRSVLEKEQKPSIIFKTKFPCHFDKRDSSKHRVTGLAPSKDGKCWVAGEGQKCIRLFDIKGRLTDKRYIGTVIDDLAMDHHGNLYMSCPLLNQIKWIQSGKMGTFENAEFTTTPCKPRGLAFDSGDNSMLVCLDENNLELSSLVKYSITKDRKCSRSFLCTMDTLKQPVRVTTNQSGDVFVSDIGTTQVMSLKDSNKHVVIHRGGSDFDRCYGLTCDCTGRLVLLSKRGRCALIIDSKSSFTVPMDDLDIDDDILSLALDNFSNLWVGCGEDNVKLYEYQVFD